MTETFLHTALVETADNPPPAGIRSGLLLTRDRVRIRYAVAPSALPQTRGTVLLLQGRSEAIEKYFETIRDINGLGYMVATFDWRGQGGSSRLMRNARYGHVPSFEAYVEDLEAVFREVVLPDCRGPYAILAHSMGGTVAMLSAPRMLNRIERIVAAAPLVSLPEERYNRDRLFYATSALRLTGLGRLPLPAQSRRAARWTPADNPLTSDAVRFRRNRGLAEAAPQLFVANPTAGWLRAATAAMRRLDDSDFIAKLQIPSLFITAGADSVVSTPAAERLAWRLRSGHALCLPKARHELLQEAEIHRAPFLAAFDAFVGGALPLE